MTSIEDTLSDEEKEEVEQAKREAKRKKTKYGSQISNE